MATTQANWIGRTIGGRYKLEGILGQGGMSAVYRATDPNLQRKVAVKLIHPHLSSDPEFVRRFEQEAASVAQLRHPNIVQVYDFNHDGPTYFMVLEYIPGETLQARLKAFTSVGQRLPLTDTIEIMTTVCEAVAYAHNRSMVHRDLKPANVMLNLTRQPILMDFGVAKMLGGTQHTATGAIIGSAKYMSPEQARGEHPDERADIYSIGVMLFEMAAGQPPFEADSDVAVLMKHASQPVPDVRQLNRNTPDPLVAVIEKALAKKRADRFQSVNEMLQALREVESATHQTLRSGTMPPTAAPSLQPIQNRKIPLWLVGAAAAVLLVLALGVGAIFLAVNIFRSSEEEIPPVAEQPASGSEEQLSSGEQAESNQAQVSDEELNLPSSAGMAKINGDSYVVGREASGQNYASPEPVTLTEFWIDQHEVTNAEYAQFIDDTAGTPPESWPEGTLPAGQENHPVKTIPWDQAVAYCEWAKKRLPTEAEWEVAARGPEDGLFPWGDDMQAVDLPRSGTYEVGSIPLNRSAFGVFDMAGNVWEWVGEPYAPVADGNQVLRGGENGFLKDMAYRLIGPPDQESIIQSAGIRCAADEVRIAPLAELLFEDSFADPSSGWPSEDVEGQPYRVGYHPPDYYHVEVRAAGQSEVVTREENFNDVTVQTNVFVDFTDTDTGDFRYGLTLRRIGEFQYYAFTISPRKGSWQALKHSSQGARIMAEGRIDTLAELGSGNRDLLRVDASGPDFVFQINGQPVAHVNDGEYTGGEVGFYVETLDESLAHVHYDDLAIGAVEEMPGLLARVLFEDEFTDPESGWLQEDVEGQPYRVGYHPPDYYHVEVRTANESEVVFGADSFEDASVEADVFVDFTDTEAGDFRYGLAVRAVDEDQFYAFTVDPRSESWQALKHSADGVEVLGEGSVDSLVGLTSGERDVLRVDARGAEFAFYINGEPVGQVEDADYADGEVGFYVETFDETLAHIHYDALTVREVEDLPAPVAQVLYDDAFSDPASGWLQEDVEGQPYRVGYHPPDYYHVEVRAANESEVVFGTESFEDATVETQVFVDFTDTEAGDFRYGLAVRAVDEDQFYAFTVDPRSESWQALKHSAGDVTVLAEGIVENMVGLTSGERDVLRVDARGAEFAFYINGEPVGQVEDADYADGEVGFYVETFDETLAHVHYDALVVQEVDTSAFDVLAPVEAPAPEVPTGMALVPAGYFEMGTSSGRAYEGPAHPVFLDAFYMDLYEVTNAQYRECVQARSCTQAGAPNSATRTGYRDDPAYNDYPIIRVTWDQANAYCQWAGKHLPTEAQWEYAASGPDHLNWPWGGTFQGSLLPAGESDTQAVGSYLDGASPFGLFDMAGNVAEWVLDDFDETFYAAAPPSNPVSADVSAGRVFRGGSFGDRTAALYATSRRDGNIRTYSDIDVGFRCALDAPELTPSEERATLVAEFCEVYAAYEPGAVCP